MTETSVLSKVSDVPKETLQVPLDPDPAASEIAQEIGGSG